MKKRSFIVFMMIAVLAAMCFTACGKKAAPTLESYINDHPEVKTEVDEQLGTDAMKGVKVEFSGNDMIYTFDLANMDNITEEVAKAESTKAALDQGLEQQTETFVNVANTILDTVKKDGAEIETVRVVVNYTYGDEAITSRTYEAGEAAAASEPAATEEASDEAESDEAAEATDGE